LRRGFVAPQAALRYAERGHRRPCGAAQGSASIALPINGETAKRFYPYAFIYQLSAAISFIHRFPPNIFHC
jgi:hypothetical protein